MNLSEQILDYGRRARAAARQLARTSTEQKNRGLLAMAEELIGATDEILLANNKDVEKAKADGLSSAMLDRLTLNPKRLFAMADGVRQVALLPDPVGETIRQWTRPDDLEITKVRVPIGVVGIIYESRPNVTSDAAVLCTKTGNATILRGGSESINSNIAIAAALSRGCAKAGLPADAILLIPTTDREAVKHLCAMDQYLDVIVPRGGKGLIETVVSHARMPVIKHYDGICIIYVDQAADLSMAESIVHNAKCQRPGVCNAVETVVIHSAVAEQFLETAGKSLLEKGVQLRCDERSLAILSRTGSEQVVAAKPEDFRTEFLDLILAVKIVDQVDEAITHIEDHGSHHSDAIITADEATAEKFLGEVDSATVYWNASTRFTDGGEFGFGAEIGISTDKLHARGPMALEELTTYKYLLRGNGQIRS
ncbi:MAG: glutamate-5-semialdehyde dehydrogenase [Verrucomicrobiaceae bacterium]|nr:MAG: glutamate-5-semialdehyde dehydrogenase [Verrucomicrobiaceae bacterium]